MARQRLEEETTNHQSALEHLEARIAQVTADSAQNVATAHEEIQQLKDELLAQKTSLEGDVSV